MTLILIFVLLTVALFALFLAGSLFIQSWLYNVPADKLPLRAAGSAALVSGFITLWAAVHAGSPDTINTILNFSPQTYAMYDSFESVRKVGDKEVKIPFRRKAGGKGSASFVDARPGRETEIWKRGDTEGIVVAVLIKEKDKEAPTRFNANLVKTPAKDTAGERLVFPEDLLYVEENGSRYMTGQALGQVVDSRFSTVLLNLLLNFLHLAVWQVACWVGLRYLFWHAAGVAVPLFLIFTLAIVPIVFDQVDRKKAAPPEKAATRAQTEAVCRYDAKIDGAV